MLTSVNGSNYTWAFILYHNNDVKEEENTK